MTIGIIGSSGHAKVAIDALKKMGHNVIYLIDDYRKSGEMTLGFQVVGGINDLPHIISEYGIDSWFIAIGDNWNRYLIYKRLESLGLNYISIIHPSAVIALDVSVQKGTIVMANAVINSGSYIGEQVILNTGVIVEHDNVINDFASLSPSSVTGGNVIIGKGAFIGINASIKNNITVGEYSVIGAGSAVVDFVSDHKIAFGVPCKEINPRKKDDKYL